MMAQDGDGGDRRTRAELRGTGDKAGWSSSRRGWESVRGSGVGTAGRRRGHRYFSGESPGVALVAGTSQTGSETSAVVRGEERGSDAFCTHSYTDGRGWRCWRAF